MSGGYDLSNNPFVALFGSEIEAEQYRLTHTHTDSKPFLSSHLTSTSESGLIGNVRNDDVRSIAQVNRIIENVFLITIDNERSDDRPPRCVFLGDVKDSLGGQEWLDGECLEQAVMERIMMADPSGSVIATSFSQPDRLRSDEVDEQDVVRYLAVSFCRLRDVERTDSSVGCESAYEACRKVLVQLGKLAFQNPSVFTRCDPGQQFVNLLLSKDSCWSSDDLLEFFELVAVAISASPEDCPLLEAFRSILDSIKNSLTELTLDNALFFSYADLTMFFTRKPCLAAALLEYNSPAALDAHKGSAYETTLFGALMSSGNLVKSEQPPFQYFNLPSQMTLAQVGNDEGVIFSNLEALNQKTYNLMFALLKLGGSVRDGLLTWLGKCLVANRGRAKLSANHMLPVVFRSLYASDGFFLTLCSVLLQLSSPFSSPTSTKLLKIQPTYCLAAKGAQANALAMNVHMWGLDETMLVPHAESEEESDAAGLSLEESYSFMTECFFMTHYCLKLGFHVLQEHLLKLNQDIAQFQRLYQDIERQDTGVSDAAQKIKQEMERVTTIYLSHKAALTQPSLLNLAFSFHAATAAYLTHVATAGGGSDQCVPIAFPLPTSASLELSALPEFLAENVQEFMLFVHRFKDHLFEEKNDLLEHFLTFILVFMGSPQFTRNPHLRAGMAEALGTLLPNLKVQQTTFQPTHFYREQLFKTHPHIEQLSNAVISAFVSIEVTGQAHFEDKFKYRQPMYQALEYMWGVDTHCNAIKHLAEYAEEHLEDSEAPLFLRFINLLINDAIYLLDEALSYMSQIKEKQEARDSGTWNELAPQQRQEMENGFRHMSMLARFHNIMGRKTIESLEMVTQHVKSIFVNGVMVDRVAAMLNYFLLHLVGRKQMNLKVKNFEDFQFVPKILVSNICQIYINLGEDSDNFCLAVSQDGRSYSHSLFDQAEVVLCKIRDPLDRISRLNEVSKKIMAMASRQAEDDEMLSDIPEDFLDPIMGTLMRDPVLLPTSGKIVDRQTIARHILSDQTDPFNRMPMTMNLVKPAVELKQEIDAWMADLRQKQTKQNAPE